MILVGQYDSPFVRRVASRSSQYGLPYEHRPWSVWGKADEIAKLNPLRRVPVLVIDHGEVLIESSAILDALDEMAPPERALLPRSGAARRGVLRLCALATGLADKAVSLLYEGVLRSEGTRSAKWIDRCHVQMHDTLDLLEAGAPRGRGRSSSSRSLMRTSRSRARCGSSAKRIRPFCRKGPPVARGARPPLRVDGAVPARRAAARRAGVVVATRRGRSASSAVWPLPSGILSVGPALSERGRLVPPARLELATSALGKPCSIQMSYGGGRTPSEGGK